MKNTNNTDSGGVIAEGLLAVKKEISSRCLCQRILCFGIKYTKCCHHD